MIQYIKFLVFFFAIGKNIIINIIPKNIKIIIIENKEKFSNENCSD